MGPCAPVAPVAPVAPLGIVKFNIAFSGVPVLVTTAFVPGAPVTVFPIVTVTAEGPVAPVGPGVPTQQHPELTLFL